MHSPFRAFGRYGGRRVGTSALTIGLVTSLASLTVIVSGPAPAGADHNPNEATAEIHITKIVYGAAAGPAGSFTTGDGPGDPIPGFDGSINDGQTESFEVAPGTYDVTEIVGVNDPAPHIFCAGRFEEDPDPLWSVSGAVLTLTPEAGSVLACVFTNNLPSNGGAPGEFNVIKIVEDDPGDGQAFPFNFVTGDNPDPIVPDLAHGDTTRLSTDAAQLIDPNTNLPLGYVVGESDPNPPYQVVSLTCGGNFGSGAGDGYTQFGIPAVGLVRPGNSQFTNCIFINRLAAGLEVVKVLADNPPPPPGDTFNLLINGNVEVGDIQNGTTFPVVVNPGLVTFGEVGQGADLGSYDATVECENRVGGAPRAFGPDPNFPTNPAAWSIALAAGDDVICTITNTYAPLSIFKDGPAQAPVGATVTYQFTLTNRGEDELTLSSAGDDKLGSLEDEIIAACGDTVLGEHVLAPVGDPGGGDVCQFSVDHVVTDLFVPLTNTVNVAYTNLAGPILASDTHTLDVLLPASVTVVVVGGDPDFELTGPGVDEAFTLDADGASVTFEELLPGQYTLDLTALEPGLVLDAIDCDPEETSVNLAAGTVVFDVADGPVTCIYTLSDVVDPDPDDDYDQYPGDDDFDFDTPFDNTDDDDDDQAPAVVAGDNQNNNNVGPGSADPGLGAAGDPGSPAPAGDVVPQAADQLPRTGSGLTRLGLMSGLLMILFGVAALLGARRRETTKA